ncbi:damage-inducible protein DinB [Polaribacter vadi]|uniref:Damage-inducible protein DinB n=1 Tax=Polaribacter vadi TaxID=1774273 RepID=A0A1B8U0T6_9FLAO|nr:DinB family protein [Polaribacter vadi]AOW16218.1 damage-inducible protein DinB [Polaribacter vadi]OBY65456.1 damage-inducible protein DinB [Polaribacter vadi]
MIPKNEYAPYFEQYMQLVTKEGKSIIENMQNSQIEFDTILRNLPKEKHNFSYAEGKWTLKELIQHSIDTERVFCYRALCFARNDKTSLPGFDQDIFVDNGNANQLEFSDLLDEMSTLRKSTIHLYKSFSDEALLRIGIASGNKISVRALGYLFSGHQMHHLNILKERYL